MNEETLKNNEDRFYNLSESHEEFNGYDEFKMMVFLPLNNLYDRNKLKFTIGKKYPVFCEKKLKFTMSEDQNHLVQSFKTIDDDKKIVSISSEYFLDDEPKLLYDEDESYEKSEFDIRKLAVEKKIRPSLDDSLSNEESVFLSGIKNDLEKANLTKDANKPVLLEGFVRDDGNELAKNVAKCTLAVDEVFGKNMISPDEIIEAIFQNYSIQRLKWKGSYLCINDAITKINLFEIQKAHSGLSRIVSDKSAKKIIGKIIANKLKKIF